MRTARRCGHLSVARPNSPQLSYRRWRHADADGRSPMTVVVLLPEVRYF